MAFTYIEDREGLENFIERAGKDLFSPERFKNLITINLDSMTPDGREKMKGVRALLDQEEKVQSPEGRAEILEEIKRVFEVLDEPDKKELGDMGLYPTTTFEEMSRQNKE